MHIFLCMLKRNKYYNERGSRTNNVRSNIPHSTLFLHLHVQIGAAVNLLTVRLLTCEQELAEDKRMNTASIYPTVNRMESCPCAMKTYTGCGGVAPFIPKLGTRCTRVEWLISRYDRFTSKEIVPATQLIGGCVEIRAGLASLEKRKIHYPGLIPHSISCKLPLPHCVTR